MIKALWFALKVGVLIALAVWVADHPGSVRIEWAEYTFTFKHTGLFLALLLGIILLSIFIYQVIKTFVDLPKSLSRYNEIKAHEKGYAALTKGLTAVAAGDRKMAVQHAKRASKFLPGDTGLPLLLEAQAARLDGREEDAAQSFVALLEDKDASFLGVRGLFQTALDSGDYEGALGLCEKALQLHPRQGWILKIAYDLQLKLRQWYRAEKTLSKAEKACAIDADKAKSDRVALYLAQAEKDMAEGYKPDAELLVKKALKLSPGFAPAVIMLAQTHVDREKSRQAQNVILKAWKTNAHGALAHFWMELQKADEKHDKLAQLRWIEKLLKSNGRSAQALRLAGQAATEAGLWGEAREYFRRAEEILPTATLYSAMAKLEERSGQDEDVIKGLLSKAAGARADRVWVCRETGTVYDDWAPVAFPHGSFNTIVWDEPYAYGAGAQASVVLLDQKAEMSEALIEAPDKPDSDAA